MYIILEMSGLGSKKAAQPGQQANIFRDGDPVLPPLASPPSCCPGSGAILLPRPGICSIIIHNIY